MNQAGTGVLLHRYGIVDEIELKGKGMNVPFTGILFFISTSDGGCLLLSKLQIPLESIHERKCNLKF